MLAVKDASSSSNRVDAFIGRERRHAAKASLLSLRPPTQGKVFRHHVTPLGTALSGLVRVSFSLSRPSGADNQEQSSEAHPLSS